MTPTDTTTAESLLAQSSWLRRLARSLVRDESMADDLCQEALLQALRGPDEGARSRPWLARAVRSLGARLGRDEERRRQRESRAARPDDLPSTGEVVEQVATQQSILAAVMELDEPYRSTILLRFWEDLAPRQVAQRMGVPVETVRTRVKRALAMLRGRLDSEFGGRRAWLVPVAAFSSWGEQGLLLASGAALVKTKIIAAAAVIVVGIAGTWVAVGQGDAPPPETGGAPALPVAAADTPEPMPEAERTAVPRAAVVEAAAPSEAQAAALFRGRVLTAEGRALADVEVRFRSEAAAEGAAARSDADGVFTLVRPDATRDLVVDDPEWTTVLAGVVMPGDSSEPIVVAAPRLRLAGLVVGEGGERLEQTLVTCSLPRDFRARFTEVLDLSRGEPWRTLTRDDGGFALDGLGVVEGAELHFTREGYLPHSMPQPTNSDTAMQVVLHQPTPVEGSLLGQVVDVAGIAVADARVSLGDATAVSGADGRFAIDMQQAGRNRQLVAMKRGHLPGRYELSEWEGAFQAADQPFALVRLGAEPLSISGELVDARGRPLAGAKIWAADPTVFGNLREGFGLVAVEGFLSGGLTVGELRSRFLPHGGEPTPGMVEQVLAENPTAKWGWVKTDAQGRFRLGGLLDREYTISAMLPDSLARVDAGPFPAGMTQARVVMPEGVVVPRIAGQVVGRRGTPVSGVRVKLVCDTVELERVTYNSEGRRRYHGSGRSEEGRSTVTDAEGRFELTDVGADHVYLSLSGDKIMPQSFGQPRPGSGGERVWMGEMDGEGAPASRGLADVGQPLDNLTVPVTLRLHLRVDLHERELADQVGAVDDAGNRINLWMMSGSEVETMDKFRLHEGRSEVLSAPEDVAMLVLFREGIEVRRVPVLLEPGKVNVVRG